jgi:rhodanese-related sulfurtransferase
MACHEAARAAVKYGYTKVFVMPAGSMGWAKAGKPMEKGT